MTTINPIQQALDSAKVIPNTKTKKYYLIVNFLNQTYSCELNDNPKKDISLMNLAKLSIGQTIVNNLQAQITEWSEINQVNPDNNLKITIWDKTLS